MAYVLIVDDDEDFAAAAAKVLTDAGHEVQVELDPHGATASLEKRRPNLVILDVMFPEDASAGFKLARAIRQLNEEMKTVPVLMLTAINRKFSLGFGASDIDDLWLPVDAFLEKPVDFGVLREKVTALLNRT